MFYDGQNKTGPKAVRVDGESLQCPDCGGDHLHHLDVRVLERPTEDSDGVITTVKGGTASLKAATSSRFHGRRGSVEIAFWCEQCGDGAPEKTLVIIQHKGTTDMHWLS